MLSVKMIEALNRQVKEEHYASNLYLAMASWCEVNGLSGCAAFMYEHAVEERIHMMKFFKYINMMDGHAIVPEVPMPPSDWLNIQTVFAEAYQHEKKVTNLISILVELSSKEQDFATLNFLQWFVSEQAEEEVLFKEVLDKVKLIGDGPQSLYFIDTEVQKINNRVPGEENGAGEA